MRNDAFAPFTGKDGTQYVALVAGLDNSNVADALKTDGSGKLLVSVSGAGSGGTSATDDAAFTAGTDAGTPIMGLVTSDSVDTGDVGVVGMDTSRNLKVSIEVDNAGIGGGIQYDQDDTDASITGTVAMMEVGSDTLQPIQGTVADGLLVNLGSNNDVTVSGVSTSAKQDTIIGHVDGIEGLLTTIDTDTGAMVTDLAAIEVLLTTIESNQLADSHNVTVDNASLTVDNAGTFAVQQGSATSTSATLQNAATANGNGSTLNTDGCGSFAVQITGLGSAVITVEASNDGGTTWVGLNMAGSSGNSVSGTGVTSNGIYMGSCAGIKLIRARISSYSSGTITVLGNATPIGTNAVQVKTDAYFNGTLASTGSGVVGAGVQRVVLATDVALPAGTNAIGKLAANSGVDIGDVDVTSIAAGDNTIGRFKLTDGTDVADILDLTNSNPLTVAIVDSSGDQISSFGGGTQYTEDAAAAANPVGTALNLIRADSLAGVTTTDGDNVAARGTDKGEVYVKHVDAIPVTDNGGALTVDGTVTAELSATDNAVLDSIDADLTTIIGHVDGLEGLIGTTNTNTGNSATSLAILDDWDESDRAKVNIVVGQAGVTAGAGAVAANTQRVTLASDDPAVASLDEIEGAVETIETTVATVSATPLVRVGIFDASDAQITTFGGGAQYTEGDTDASITGTAMLMEVGSDTLQPVQGTVAAGLLVNLGSNNDVTVTGTVDLGATDNAVLDAIAASVAAIDTDATTIIGHLDGVETLLGTIDADTSGIITSVQLLDDTVFAEDVAAQAADKGIAILAVRRDADTSLVGTDNDYANLQVNANGALKVEAFSGETLPVSLTSTTVTGTVAVTQSGTWDEVGINDSGNSITVDNGGTFVVQENGAALTALQLIDNIVGVEDAAETAGGGLAMMGSVRRDTAASSAGTTGDNATINTDANGNLWTTLGTKLDSTNDSIAVHAVTTGGATPYKLNSAASTNATNVKASAGQVYSIMCTNTNAAVRYLKLYNKASSPTVGTDTPVQTYAVPGATTGGGFSLSIPVGMAFSSGISFATTTESTDAGTTGVAANEILINLTYK